MLDWKADTHAAWTELALLPPEQDPSGLSTNYHLICDEWEGDFTAAARDLAACPLAEIAGMPRAIFAGDIARYRGDAPAAAAAYSSARPLIEAQARQRPKDSGPISSLACLDAWLGHGEAALAEGRQLLSLATAGDALGMPSATLEWAQVLTFAGRHDEAIRALQTICGQPYGPDYGDLRRNPDWNPLRPDPRFEAMIASLSPK